MPGDALILLYETAEEAIIARINRDEDDELLGIREHGKSKEDKDKQLRDSVRKYYSLFR